jgi:hypothetical protein
MKPFHDTLTAPAVGTPALLRNLADAEIAQGYRKRHAFLYQTGEDVTMDLLVRKYTAVFQ